MTWQWPAAATLHAWVQRGLMTVVLGGAAINSFTSIAHLAQRCGFEGLSWAFPFIVDAAAAYGMAVWLRHQRAWREAAFLTLAAVAFSTTINVIDHYAPAHDPVAAGMGALAPAMLAGVLFVAHRNNRVPSTRPVPGTGPVAGLPSRVPQNPPPKTPGTPVPSTEPNQPVPNPRPAPRKPGTPVPDPHHVTEVRTRLGKGEKITKQVVMDEYRIGTAKALAVLAAARNGHGGA